MGETYLTDTATGNPLNQTMLSSLTALSTSIDFNNSTITGATLTAVFSGNTPTFSMAADGSTFETVTSGTPHTFATTGTDLRWKAVGAGTTITQIKIEDYH